MSARFEELGWRQTPIGEISLRRRFDPTVRADVYEVKLGDEYLMSSLFTVAERELSRLGLGRTPGDRLDVLVGGLGLGYTAREALLDKRIRTLTVIEYSDAVIDWHRQELLPDTAGLAGDPRVEFVCADFFAAAAGPVGFDQARPGRVYDALLLDIDHSPRHTSCTDRMPRSTPARACGRSRITWSRAAPSRCGPTTHPMMGSALFWNPRSSMSRRGRSCSTTR
ncbi:hypothetical protein [Nocardia fluminea]|uniref:hypothetical protein n=1 Tax=Nocardia fluminea TaxID=134984 RepID=UPI0033F939AE